MATIYAEVPSFQMMVPGVTRDLYPTFRSGAAKSGHVKVIQYAMTRPDLTIQLEPNEEYMYFPEAVARIIFPNGQNASPETQLTVKEKIETSIAPRQKVAGEPVVSEAWKQIVPTLTQEEIDAAITETEPETLDLNTAAAPPVPETIILCNVCGDDFKGKTAKARWARHMKTKHAEE